MNGKTSGLFGQKIALHMIRMESSCADSGMRQDPAKQKNVSITANSQKKD